MKTFTIVLLLFLNNLHGQSGDFPFKRKGWFPDKYITALINNDKMVQNYKLPIEAIGVFDGELYILLADSGEPVQLSYTIEAKDGMKYTN